MFVTSDDLIKLAVAMLVGCAIGLEREFHNKAAGLRTIILICVGATLITIISQRFGDSRIAAQIVTGIGFLGGGVIIRGEEGRVRGLTTASTIWMAAALGLTIGYGEYILAAVCGVIAIVVLWLFTRLDAWLDRRAKEPRVYDLVCLERAEKSAELEQVFKQHGVTIVRRHRTKRDGVLHMAWETQASVDNHERLVTALLDDAEVRELRY